MAKKLEDLQIKIFGDGADISSILELNSKPYISGFTTNPTLMRKAGISDYEAFAKDILSAIPDKPVSFEVFSDDFVTMEAQARMIASWGNNVYVKIPITNTAGVSSFDLIKKLAHDGIKVNVTAILTVAQVRSIVEAFPLGVPGIISVFAGRIADTGVDPVLVMTACKDILLAKPNLKLLWASPRELLNIFQADDIECDIITVTPDILKKLDKIGYDLNLLSLDTVKMFYDDGRAAGFSLSLASSPSSIAHPATLGLYGSYIDTYLAELHTIVDSIDRSAISAMIEKIYSIRMRGGRLFIIGVGGSAGNASHAVNDFRKICGIETYAPTDNVSELTAWTNDNGFEHIFEKWLRTSQLQERDAVLVFSVGGGTATVSSNIVRALEFAKERRATVLGIVSRDGGVTAKMADACVLVPVIDSRRITPHAESWQAVLWHLIANAIVEHHPIS